MAGKLVLVRTRRQYNLASTFLRFQEHHEGPKFRGEIFSLEEYMDWYAVEFGNFTYYTDWSGFNVPSSVFKKFKEGKFNPLSAKEKLLLEALKDIPEPFYVVGIFGDKPDLPTLKHELVHGLFYTVPEYQEEVLQVLKSSDTNPVTKALKKAGYHSAVWMDEINAYLLSGASDLRDDGFEWTEKSRKLQKDLRQIFRNHFEFALHNANVTAVLDFFHTITV